MSKVDVAREREAISLMSGQLKHELKQEIVFQPPKIGAR